MFPTDHRRRFKLGFSFLLIEDPQAVCYQRRIDERDIKFAFFLSESFISLDQLIYIKLIFLVRDLIDSE